MNQDVPNIHPNAPKHLERSQVLQAWNTVTESIECSSALETEQWLMIGWLDNGSSVELIAVLTEDGWLVIHAKAPAEKKFLREIERTKRRS